MKIHKLHYLIVFIVVLFFSIGTGVAENDSGTGVPDTPDAVCPILIGESIPEIVIKTPKNKPFNLKTAIHEKPAVLIFFRGGW